MENFNLFATAASGLEASVKRELARLGYPNARAIDGRVEFTGGPEAIAAANLHLRCAGRVWVKIGAFRATTFDELFEQTRALPWGDWIPVDGEFTVIGKSVKSTLHSVPDCQSIVKKAIVEKLKQKYKVSWFDETGPAYTVAVNLMKDEAVLAIDTSGSGLHRRGYRENALSAPLKETLAAALLELSFWNRERILMDPCCGSGTILIEAALIARNIAPGLSRHFAAEGWAQVPPGVWKEARAAAYAAIDYDFDPELFGGDIDPAAIALAEDNAAKAGVDDCIHFRVQPCQEATLPGHYGCLMINPPYGDRLGELQEVEDLCRALGRLAASDPTWSAYVMTAMENFEKLFGKKADAKRKLYNGGIRTDYYQFYGPRPPKK